MKLSNLSLAVMLALGAVACGGSNGDDSNTQISDRPTPAPTPAPVPVPDALDDNTVDPTKTHVVDNKDLEKQSTVGVLQYIRREDSQYDRNFNPSQPASASPLLGVSLDKQNPRLTNIVLARQDLQRADGVPVKAQFTGSITQDPLDAKGQPVYAASDNKGNGRDLFSLQAQNFPNVDILADAFGGRGTNGNNTGALQIKNNDKVIAEGRTGGWANGAHGWPKPTTTANIPGLQLLASAGVNNANVQVDSKFVDAANRITAMYADTKAGATATNAAFYDYATDQLAAGKPYTMVVAADAVQGKLPTNLSRVGRGLVWWSTPATGFENERTRNGTVASGLDAVAAGETSNWATNGLIRIGGDQDTLGQELVFDKNEGKWKDHHNTTTRIFGRYHLAYRDLTDNVTRPVMFNTFTGAKSFISSIEVPEGMVARGGGISDADRESLYKTGKARTYSIGAMPDTVRYVQYGRVTTNLDVELDTGTFGDGFQYADARRKADTDGVDNYFYRGINATSIAEMAALPKDKKLVYQGHALMYGIDNSYHGAGGNNLPNAFAYGSSGLGLGNFVEATADLSTNELVGTVYNAWLLDQNKSAVTNDVLVNFSGKIHGNTVVGTADRRYIAGDDAATFKASFFGNAAEELGGAFNSVKDEAKYGSAYATGDWGGVFGAKQAGSSNTFQGDDGAQVYSGLGN